MSGLAEALAAVDAAPEGPEVGAFFDLDGTLLDGYSAAAFYRERMRRREMGLAEFARTMGAYLDGKLGGDASAVGHVTFEAMAGQASDDLDARGVSLFKAGLGATIRPGVRELVAAHRARGHTVVLATAATSFQARPFAEDLEVDHVLCTKLAVDDARAFTGAVDGAMLWGVPKAQAVLRLARSEALDLRRSYAYANGAEDVPFLAVVGNPRAVDPEPGLARVAQASRWPVVEVDPPPGGGLRAQLGTVASIAGLNVAAVAGRAVGAVLGGERRSRNMAMAWGMDVSLAAAGVKLDVVGRENLEKARPAVFMMNHQSELDPLVAGALIRHDAAAVGKVEASQDPRVALLGWLVGAVWVDRSDSEAARASMARLHARVAAGESVLIAPEGTRTPTAKPAPFKKGGFHIAQQCGVPVVPIVLRDTGRLMPRGSKTIRPGTVHVAVLPPVPTDDWRPETMSQHAAEVRDMYVRTLERWPGDGR